jgi:hypothetical protein
VTELRMRQLNRVDFASLPFENAIKITRGNGSRRSPCSPTRTAATASASSAT